MSDPLWEGGLNILEADSLDPRLFPAIKKQDKTVGGPTQNQAGGAVASGPIRMKLVFIKFPTAT